MTEMPGRECETGCRDRFDRRTLLAGAGSLVAGGLAGCVDAGEVRNLASGSHATGDADVPEGLLDGAEVQYPDAPTEVDAEIHEYHDGYHLDYLDPENRFWVRPLGVETLGGNPLTRDLSGEDPAAWFAPIYGGGLHEWELHLLANEAFADAIDGGEAYYATIGDGPDGNAYEDIDPDDPYPDVGWGDAGDGVLHASWTVREDRVIVVAQDTGSLFGGGGDAPDPVGVFIEGTRHDEPLDPRPPEPSELVREEDAPDVTFEHEYDPETGELELVHAGGDTLDADGVGVERFEYDDEGWTDVGAVTPDPAETPDRLAAGDSFTVDAGDANAVTVFAAGTQTDHYVLDEDPSDGEPDVEFEYGIAEHWGGTAGIRVVHAGGEEIPRSRIRVADPRLGFELEPIEPFPEQVGEGDAASFQFGGFEMSNLFQIVYTGDETETVYETVHVTINPPQLWEEPTIDDG